MVDRTPGAEPRHPRWVALTGETEESPQERGKDSCQGGVGSRRRSGRGRGARRVGLRTVLATVAIISCEGPTGPMGPPGPAYCPAPESFSVHVETDAYTSSVVYYTSSQWIPLRDLEWRYYDNNQVRLTYLCDGASERLRFEFSEGVNVVIADWSDSRGLSPIRVSSGMEELSQMKEMAQVPCG